MATMDHGAIDIDQLVIGETTAQETPKDEIGLWLEATRKTPGKRGRPKKEIGADGPPPTTKLIHKIMAAVNNHPGQPILYASTTKGTMKLVVDGHHFRYSFRKGKYTIFQCCYKENKEECVVRVVTDQKRVYPLDGEHVHFIQATDKSVTSVKFTPGEDPEMEQQSAAATESNADTSCENEQLQAITAEEVNPVFIDDILSQPRVINVVKLEKDGAGQHQLEFTTETTETPTTVINNAPTETSTTTEDANEFREKIKKRLQKALLGKKK